MGDRAGRTAMGAAVGVTFLSAIRLLVAACFLLIGWIACGGDSNGGGALANLTDEQLTTYNTAIDSLDRTAGFELMRPAYLPLGTDWLPSTDYIADLETAVLQFFPLEPADLISESPVILIDQVADPNRRHCPPCPGVGGLDLETYQLDDIEVMLDEGRSGENGVFLAVYLRAEDIRVHASFHWQLEPGVPPAVTEDMRAEALKVVESMLDED